MDKTSPKKIIEWINRLPVSKKRRMDELFTYEFILENYHATAELIYGSKTNYITFENWILDAEWKLEGKSTGETIINKLNL